jgi:hypothetical protein
MMRMMITPPLLFIMSFKLPDQRLGIRRLPSSKYFTYLCLLTFDSINEVMENEPCETLTDMDNHVFDDEPEDDEADNDDQDLLRTDSNVQPVQPCLMDFKRTGWDKLPKLNVQEIRQHAKDCLVRNDKIHYDASNGDEIKFNVYFYL